MENSTTKTMEKTSQIPYCELNSTESYFLVFSAVQFLFSLTTILENALILVALYKESSLHKPSKLLYSSLAIVDLFVGLIAGPAAAVYFMLLGIETNNWMSICVYCTTIAGIGFTLLTSVSLLTLASISVDRLLALSLGLRYKQVVTLRRVQAYVVCIWIPCIAYAAMKFWKSDTVAKSFGYILHSLSLLVPACCYSKIFFALRHHQAGIQNNLQKGKQDGELSLNVKRYRKSISTALYVLLAAVVCFLPNIVVTAVVATYGPLPSMRVIWGFTTSLVFLNSSLNPVLYCWKIKEVRQAAKMTIRQLFGCSS